MQKLFLILTGTMFFATETFFSSCNSDSGQDDSENSDQPSASRLIGSWQSYKVIMDNETSWDDDTIFSFKSDGTGTWKEKEAEPEQISYQFSQNLLCIYSLTDPETGAFTYQVIKLNATELIMSHTHPSFPEMLVITYYKRIQ